MSTLEQRAEARRARISIKQVDLHSKEHNSFHPHLDLKSAWELLARLSKEAWIEQTGEIPPSSVDKSVVKFINLGQKA